MFSSSTSEDWLLYSFAAGASLLVFLCTPIVPKKGYNCSTTKEVVSSPATEAPQKVCNPSTTKEALSCSATEVPENECKRSIQKDGSILLTFDGGKSVLVPVEVRAYCPCPECCGEHADGKTAIGREAHMKGVAGYPFLPYGDWLYIPDYGWAQVDDCGGKVRRMFLEQKPYLEIRFPTHEEALKWGVKLLYLETADGYKELYGGGTESRNLRRWRFQRHSTAHGLGEAAGP